MKRLADQEVNRVLYVRWKNYRPSNALQKRQIQRNLIALKDSVVSCDLEEETSVAGL
jgi:hypothetical protein